MFGTTTSLCQGTSSSLRATKASPATMLSWFKRGNAVSAEDNDAVPIDDDAVPNHDSVPRRHGGVVRGNGRSPWQQAGAPTVHSVAGLAARRRPLKRVAMVSLSASSPAPLPMALASA